MATKVIVRVLFSLLALSSVGATSLELYEVSYDKVENIITIEGGYGGGCVEHEWDLNMNNICMKSSPSQQTALLYDKVTEMDNCEAFLSRSLTFDATPYIDACGKPTYLTIENEFGQKKKVLID